MKSLLIVLLLLPGLPGKGQDLLPDSTDFFWQEQQDFWEELLNNPDYRDYYKGNSPEQIMQEALEYARKNGVDPNHVEEFLGELADDISDQFLDQVGEEVLNRLMEEIGLTRALDKAYEQALKAALPKGIGIPVHDPGMKPAITEANTAQNLKVMLKHAIEKWLNQQWDKQSTAIYRLQRGDLEYRKNAGITALLQMADLRDEHFLSLEINIPEQVLDYAVQVRQIYESAEASLDKGKDLYAVLNITATELKIPQGIAEMTLLKASTEESRLSSWDLINQRRKSLALAYLQLAERSQEKAEDLHQAIKKEGHFKMTDADRLKAQDIINAYLEDHFRYKEKADKLLMESLQNAGMEHKNARLAKYHKQLRLKNMAE
jgi:hypothetical protein